jgi:CRISPR-associated protein Cpf1
MKKIDNKEDIYIIGIDRGERHLLYLTLICYSGKGEIEIKEQFSLNEIVSHYNGNEYKTDYQVLLDNREKARQKERESWKTIESIKELKEGYMSQVIHKIAELMREYKAIVVLEDLNRGFTNSRKKVEKSVYEKFETALVEKLKYLILNKKEAQKNAQKMLSAFQLVNNQKYTKIFKQSGFLFYVPADYTSKIDPITGFVDFLKPKYEDVGKAQAFFKKFSSIRYCKDEGKNKKWFEFSFDYEKFTKKTEGLSNTKWTVIIDDKERYVWNKFLNNNKGGQEPYFAFMELKKMFDNYSVSYEKEENLIEQIANQNSPDFFKKIIKSLSVCLSLRYNNGKKGENEEYYILSPIERNGNCYNSREEVKKGKDAQNRWKSELPVDADANGAYNIARKGLILLKRLKDKGIEEFEKSKKTEKSKPSQWLPNKEWLQFAQNQ